MDVQFWLSALVCGIMLFGLWRFVLWLANRPSERNRPYDDSSFP